MADRDVYIRLSVKDGALVEQALNSLGAKGQAAFKRIQVASEPATKGILAVNAAAQEGKAIIQGYASNAGSLGAALSAMGTGGIAAAAGIGALTLGISAALRQTKAAIDEFSLLVDAADKIGVTTEALQELRFAASQSGVEQTALDSALEKFVRNIGNASRGVQSAVKIFDSLGVSIRDAKGELKPVEQIFSEVSDRIRGMNSASAQASTTMELFGRGSGTLVNLLRLGSDGLDEFSRKARESGIIIEDYLLRSAEDTGDKLELLSKIIDTNIKDSFVKLSPVLIFSTELWKSMAEQIGWVADKIAYLITGMDSLDSETLKNDLAEIINLQQELENQKNNASKNQTQQPAFSFAPDIYAQAKFRDSLLDTDKRIEETKKKAKQIMDILAGRNLQAQVDVNGKINLIPKVKPIIGIPGEDGEGEETNYNTLANKKILESLDLERRKLELILQGKDAEAEVLAIKEKLIGATQPEIDQATELERRIYAIKQQIEAKKKSESGSLDINARTVQALADQLDIQKTINAAGERAAFIKQELAKLDEKATQVQRDQVARAAAQIFDEKYLAQQRTASEQIIENNRRIIESIAEQIQYEQLLLDQGQRAADAWRAAGQIQIDTTGLNTATIESQRKSVEALAESLVSLRDAQEANQLTMDNLAPSVRFEKDIARLKELQATGRLSAEAFSAEYERAYRRMLENSNDAWSGMERGILRFRDTVGTVADQMERVFNGALQSISDFLTEVIGKGKIDLQSLGAAIQLSLAREAANSITAGIAASFQPQTASFATAGGTGGGNNSGGFLGVLSGLFGGLFGGFRASGGDVSPGRVYVVGEKRPELFIPESPGRIIPDVSSIITNSNASIINSNSSTMNSNSTTSNTSGNVTRVEKIEVTQNFYGDKSGSSRASGGQSQSRRQAMQDLAAAFAETSRR